MLTIKSNENATNDSLNNLNLNFEDNGMVFVCGKKDSSAKELVKLIGGIIYNPNITITLNDFVLDDNKKLDDYRLNYIGYVFGNSQHINKETVLQNILNSVVLFTDNISDELVNNVLTKTNLLDKKETLVKDLSEYELHCLDIARALLKDPSIIIANNPIARLNDEEAKQIWTLLKDISKNCLVIVGNALQEVAKLYADRIIAFDANIVDQKLVQKIEDTVIKNKNSISPKHDIVKTDVLSFKKSLFIATTLIRNSIFLIVLVLISVGLFLVSSSINADAHSKYAHALAERQIDSVVISRNDVYSTSSTEYYIPEAIIEEIDNFSSEIDVRWGNHFINEVAVKYTPHSNQTGYRYPSTIFKVEDEEQTDINLLYGSWDNSESGVYISKSAAESYQAYFNKYTQNEFNFSFKVENTTYSYQAELFNKTLNVTENSKKVTYLKEDATLNPAYLGSWSGTINEEAITIVLTSNCSGYIGDEFFTGAMNGSKFEMTCDGDAYVMSYEDGQMKLTKGTDEAILTKDNNDVATGYLGSWKYSEDPDTQYIVIYPDGRVTMSLYSGSSKGTYKNNSSSIISELVKAYETRYPDGEYKIGELADLINNSLLFVYANDFKELNVAGIFEDNEDYADCIVITENYTFPSTYDAKKFISIGYATLSSNVDTNTAFFDRYATIIRNEQEGAYITSELDSEYEELYGTISKIPGRINIATVIFVILTVGGSYLLSYLLLSTYRKELTLSRTYGLKKKELYKIVLIRSAIISVVGTVVSLILTLIGLTIANAVIRANYDFIAFSFFTIPGYAYLWAVIAMFAFTGIFTLLAIRSISKNDFIIY